MKVVLVLLLALVAVCSGQISAQFGQSVQVNSTATSYGYLASPLGTPILFTVSSANAQANSRVIVNNFVNIPGVPVLSGSGSVAVNGGLPAGYAGFASDSPLASFLGVGMYINFTSEIDGSSNAVLTLAPFAVAQLNASVVASFRPLSFDASTSTYAELPPSQYNVSVSGGIQIYTNRSVTLVFSSRTYTAIAINVTANAVTYANLVANTAATFAITEGTRVAFTIYNLTAASGTFAISASNNVSAAAGNLLISSIYSLNHSAGANAQVSASLRYDTANSGQTLSASVVANSAWYVWTNGAWVRQASSVSGTVVVYNTNHFSQWSVQSGGNSTSATTGSGTTGNQTGAASRMSSVFSLLKCLF